MHKTILPIYLVSLCVIFSGFKPQGNTFLIVEVSNLQKKAGTKIFVSVFSENDFLVTSIQTKSVLASGNKVIIDFNLPPGEYAVSTYQDLNSNGKIDRYFIGKPKEPYGFSNNVKRFGPPNYKDCKFTLANTPKSISISLIN